MVPGFQKLQVWLSVAVLTTPLSVAVVSSCGHPQHSEEPFMSSVLNLFCSAFLSALKFVLFPWEESSEGDYLCTFLPLRLTVLLGPQHCFLPGLPSPQPPSAHPGGSAARLGSKGKKEAGLWKMVCWFGGWKGQVFCRCGRETWHCESSLAGEKMIFFTDVGSSLQKEGTKWEKAVTVTSC